MNEATHHLGNDSPSFHPVHSQVRAVGLRIYTMRMDAALGQQCHAGVPPHLPIQNLLKRSKINQPGHFNEGNNHGIGITGIFTNDVGGTRLARAELRQPRQQQLQEQWEEKNFQAGGSKKFKTNRSE